MVSLRRRRLLGLCSGRSCFLAPVLKSSDGVATNDSNQNSKAVAVHPLPLQDNKQQDKIPTFLLLYRSIVSRDHTWLSDLDEVMPGCLISASILVQLPIYLVISLGCYGLFMVGIGLMQFPTCPQEAILLRQDISEAKEFMKQRGVDVGPD